MSPPKQHSFEGVALDVWLQQREAADFPPFDQSRGEKSHKERYLDIRTALAPYQVAAEKGALLASATKWQTDAIEKIRQTYASDSTAIEKHLQELEDAAPFVYLNSHGPGHVDKVIHRATGLLQTDVNCALTAYEGYLLLCAIQFHDIGNFFGRDEHEQKCKRIMETDCKHIIRDRVERNTIVRIAMVHGGAYEGNRDTIAALRPAQDLMGQPGVRKRFLAALLRFADELADDCSRADNQALANNTLPSASIQHHRYSESLHSVGINREEITLCFAFGSDLAMAPLTPSGPYLLDEIYTRTLKMERERRYCMRFLRPVITIERIRVEIEIEDSAHPLRKERITYTLEENGYPIQPSPRSITDFGGTLLTGAAQAENLRRIWAN